MKALSILIIFIALLISASRTFSQDFEPLIQIAKEYYDAEKYDSAAVLYEAALPLIVNKFGVNDTGYYARQLLYTAYSYLQINKYEKAKTYYGLAVSVYESQSGIENPWYIKSLRSLRDVLRRMDKYKECLTVSMRILEIDIDQLGQENAQIAMDLNFLGSCYEELDQFEKADSLFLRAIAIDKKVLGEEHPQLAIHLNNLASLYNETGRYMLADSLYKKAIEIDIRQLGEMDPQLSVHYNNLSINYQDMGQFELAEPMLLKAIEIDQFNLKHDSSIYYSHLGSLARLYEQMGRFDEAEKKYLEVMGYSKRKLGEDNPSYAIKLNNLAGLYSKMKKFNQAEALYLKALEIDKEQLGETSSQYSRHLGNLAVLYGKAGKYEKAEPLFIKEAELTRQIYGENHPEYAGSLNNLAKLYYYMGNYDKIPPLLNQALEIDKKTLGEHHPEYAKHLYNNAVYFIKIGEVNQAQLIYRRSFEIFRNYLICNDGFLSEKEYEQFVKTFLIAMEDYQSCNYLLINNLDSKFDFAYDIELFQKGLLLNSMAGIKNRILKSNDSSLIQTYNTLLRIRSEINYINSKAPDIQKESLSLLKIQENAIEKEMALKSQEYSYLMNENEIKYQDILLNLKNNDISIEFSSFSFYRADKLTDSTLYSAIVIKESDTLAHMLFLCEEKQLKNALPDSSANFKEIDRCYNDQVLYNLLWKPLDSLLQGQSINTVYFAPSGLLNSVAFSAIKCPDGKLLSEKYNLVQLSSTRTLAMTEEPAEIKDAVIFGGIKYETDTTEWIANAFKYKKEERDLVAYNATFRGATRGGWAYLPGTKKEMEQVADKLAKKDIDTTTFSGINALEESFYALSGNNSPSVIHVSTHGFYYPDTVSDEYRKNMMNSATGDIQFKYADDPLLRSGLILAGGNNTWKGLPRPEGLEDGILTAREVSNMNLLNTELVVLSACQTGQGDVKGSEGVEGLQRGFKMAGVHYIIMSLWEVPDKETTEFMEHFYSLWPGGDLSIREAFRETQLRMMRKYPNEPFKWAGFVLME